MKDYLKKNLELMKAGKAVILCGNDLDQIEKVESDIHSVFNAKRVGLHDTFIVWLSPLSFSRWMPSNVENLKVDDNGLAYALLKTEETLK